MMHLYSRLELDVFSDEGYVVGFEALIKNDDSVPLHTQLVPSGKIFMHAEDMYMTSIFRRKVRTAQYNQLLLIMNRMKEPYHIPKRFWDTYFAPREMI